jgi:hypothetical protein
MRRPRAVFRLPVQFALVLSLVVALSAIDAYLPVGAQTNKTPYRQDLARFFAEHEEVQLDSRVGPVLAENGCPHFRHYANAE